MRPVLRPAVLVALTLLGGCSGYVAHDTPVAPNAEVVRVPFPRPRRLAIAHGMATADRASARTPRSDTLLNVSGAYGRVVSLQGDTLTLALTQVSRSGTLERQPAETYTVIDRRDA